MIGRILSVLAVALLVCAPARAEWTAPLPEQGVEVLWDSFGVPHIYADSEEGAFYAFGHAQARAHGNILLRMLGESRGRGAEYWGASYEEQDRWIAANDVYPRAQSWFDQQTPQMQADLDAFARGINDFVAVNPAAVEPDLLQVLPLSGVDIMAHTHRLMNFFYIASPGKVLVNPEINTAGGSNAWALAPSRTQSGNAMLLANPHLPWSPGRLTYFEAQISAPGLAVYGATQVGLPVLRFAFNNDLGFTNTVNTMLGFTSYRLSLTDEGYMFDGEERAFRTEEKQYKVRQEDGTLKTVRFQQRYAVQGPVFDLPDNGGTIALKVAGLDRPGVLQQYLDMGKAHDWAGFRAAVERLQPPMFNIVYADRDGHIFYLDNGILPKRDHGDLDYWSAPVPGDRSDTLWQDVHAFADLPQVLDPPSGFVQNANDPPWLATWPRILNPSDYPAYVAPVGPFSQRAQLSIKLLAGDDKLSFDDFVERKTTTLSLMAQRMVPDLLEAAKAQADPDLSQAIALLEGWDYHYEPDARGALLFETWAALFSPDNFRDLSNYAVPWSLDDPLETPRCLRDPAQAVSMLKQAVGKTQDLYGALDRPYGEVSRFHIGDVNLPGNGGFGNTGAFRTITWQPMKDGQRTPRHGETWISMVEFSTPLKARGLMSYGNSSQPGSPHTNDQLRFLSDKTYRTLWVNRQDVEANLEEREWLDTAKD